MSDETQINITNARNTIDPVNTGSGNKVDINHHFHLQPSDAPGQTLVNTSFDGRGVGSGLVLLAIFWVCSVLICFARKKKGAWITSRTADGIGLVFGTAVVSIWELLMNVMWAADLNGSWAKNWPNFGLKLIH
uniref:Uncharacterized protein n=1 Tax=Solanum tuberosum TaxID=4113 RepID=M1B5H6_SOLTU